jgi:hypothetical protein
MNKLIYFTFICLMIFAVNNCTTGSSSISKGLDNISYLEFVSASNADYGNGVDVAISDKKFMAKVNKSNEKPRKGTVYSIPTGKQIVTVTHNNKVIFSRQIFISAQETKQIILP